MPLLLRLHSQRVDASVGSLRSSSVHFRHSDRPVACALSLSQLHSHCYCYLTLPGRRAPSLSHTHTHTQQLQAFAVCVCLRVCSCEYVCVCACVYLASLVSPSFGGISTKGQCENNKNCPCAQLSHVFHSRLQPFLLLTRFVPLLAFVSSPLVSCIHFLGIRIVLCAVSHSFFCHSFSPSLLFLFSFHFFSCYISNHCFLSKLSIPLGRHSSHSSLTLHLSQQLR